MIRTDVFNCWIFCKRLKTVINFIWFIIFQQNFLKINKLNEKLQKLYLKKIQLRIRCTPSLTIKPFCVNPAEHHMPILCYYELYRDPWLADTSLD